MKSRASSISSPQLLPKYNKAEWYYHNNIFIYLVYNERMPEGVFKNVKIRTVLNWAASPEFFMALADSESCDQCAHFAHAD